MSEQTVDAKHLFATRSRTGAGGEGVKAEQDGIQTDLGILPIS